jgi:hypothetical protein
MRFVFLAVVVAVAAGCAGLPIRGNPRPCADCSTAAAAPAPTEVIAYQAPLALADMTPAVAGSNAPAFDMLCDNTSRRVEASAGQSYNEIFVWNAACAAGTCTPSATPVFLGGSQTTAVTVSTGIPICNTSGCVSQQADLEVKGVWCITNGATVHVTAQVMQRRRRDRRRRRRWLRRPGGRCQ